MTAEELLHTAIPGKWTELVRGQLRVSEPPGIMHGIVAGRLIVRVGQHVYANGLGEVAGQDTGFQIASNPDTVRAPDVAFLSNVRVSVVGKPRGYGAGAPDLAAEILSPATAQRRFSRRLPTGRWPRGAWLLSRKPTM